MRTLFKRSKRIIILLLGLFSLMWSATAQNCFTTNVAAGKPVTANLELSYAPASNITDGNLNTSWAGDQDGIYWAYVDLGQSYPLCKSIVKWNPGSVAPGIKIQGSNTAINDWVDLAATSGNDVGQFSSDNSYSYDDIDLSSSTTSYRYVRLYIPFSSAWGPKVKEFEIYIAASGPSVSITSPSDGTEFLQGTSVSFTANASEQGGSISKVEYYQGSTLIGQATASPYQFTWQNVQEGNYLVIAKAYDATNATAVSQVVNVYVNDLGWSLLGNTGNTATTFFGTTDNQPVIFKTNNAERLRVTTDGRLLINTASVNVPSDALLAVNGNTYVRKLTVTQATWADYVFDKSYKLPTLSGVESYIKTHHHLPGIAPATIIQNKGLDVGSSQQVLLQKIEELTLYIIELNKKVNRLEKENHELKSRNVRHDQK